MFNGIDKPERTYTLEDFIGFKAQDNMTYYNFSILSKSILFISVYLLLIF